MAPSPSPRLFDRVCRTLRIEPQEGRLLVLMGALVGTLMCAYTIAKVLRDALFIAEFGALALPYAYIGVALATVVFVWIEGVVTRRFTRDGATRFNHYAAIGFGAAAAISLPLSPRVTVICFYLWTGSQAMMMLPRFWGLALDVWNSQRARHVFPLLAGFGLIGGLAGGAFSAWSVSLLQNIGLMWVMVGLLAAAHALTLVLERHRALTPGSDEAPSRASRWDILRRSRYLKIFAVTLALSVMAGTLVDFQFKYYLQHAYRDPRDLTRFLGVFYVVLNSAALVFQFGAAAWLMQRLGLGTANGIQPASIVALSAWVALSPGWWAIVTLRAVQGVVSQSVGKTANEIYYAAIRPSERRLIKPAIDTLVERWSDAVVGVLLIFVLQALRVRIPALAIGTAALTGVWLVFAILLHREFGAAFEKAMSGRWIDPEAVQGSMAMPSARRALLAALQSDDPAGLVFALELSRGTRDPKIAGAVRACLRHASPVVRAAAIQAMEAIRLRDREGVIEALLADADESVRRAAVAYLLTLGPEPAEFARRVLEGEDAVLRRYLVDAMFDRPFAAGGLLTAEWIEARLGSGSREDQLLAARALGAMTGHAPAQMLRGLLASTDVEIQREALRSATRRPNPELLDRLLALLPVPELSYQARHAVAAAGDAAVPGLRGMLGGESGAHAQELAARTLSRIASARAIEALMIPVRSGDVRLRYIGLRGLARMRVRTGRQVLSRSLTHRLFLRELNDYRRAEEAALALEKHATPAIRLLGESSRESAGMALERAMQALACWYEPKPLPGVFEHIQSSRRETSPALEYLGHVLPREVFRPVQKIFEPNVTDPGQAPAGDEQVAERIRLAWESGDEWLRACAVHASRALSGFDPGLFASGDGGSRLVRAQLAALTDGSPPPRAGSLEARTC